MKAVHVLIVFFLGTTLLGHAQAVLNGDFTGGTANWGCTPELNPESVYGGPTANTVAELDNLVSLCQTISGFTIGSVYDLRYAASRRLGGCPGPNPADISVTMAGLATTDSRTNTVWALSPSLFQFTATTTTHTLSLASQFPAFTTCGFIIDDIAITLASPFGVDLKSFELAESENGLFEIRWQTTQEENLIGFRIECSADGQNWKRVTDVQSRGEGLGYEEYAFQNDLLGMENGFCRLLSQDRAGTSQVLAVSQFSRAAPVTVHVYPNPTIGNLEIDLPSAKTAQIELFDSFGKKLDLKLASLQENHASLDLEGLRSGLYFLHVTTVGGRFSHKVIVAR